MMKQAFCYVKGLAKRMKRQATEWEKILASHKSDKRLVSRMHKELWKFNSKKPTIQLESGQRHKEICHQKGYTSGK